MRSFHHLFPGFPPVHLSALIPSYPLLPHSFRSYICDVGSNIVRRFVGFSWYCLSSVTRLAWPSALVRRVTAGETVAGRSLVQRRAFHPLRSIPFKQGVL